MLKLSSVPFALAMLTALSAAPSTAQAGIEYPWCAIYTENTVGATNCGFVSLAQCRAALNGIGGMCNENPAYRGVSPQPPKKRPARS